jgi:hypothetical protein
MSQKLLLTVLLAGLTIATLFAKTLSVGAGQTYPNLTAAARQAQPGDTILFRTGVYTGGQYPDNLQGTAAQWIHILAAPGANVIIRGSTEAWHFSDGAYLHISGIIFEQQTGNGVNIDDSGSYATPSHHILIENCIFRNMNATGNNDLLKLSGVDSFEVRHCKFLNGAAGGSGIDMVGCHHGVIQNNRFENLGSTGIQAKGGTQFIRIEANFFKNAGARALNLGGSTGLQFFRPMDAPFEAADLQVYANIFMGSQAPVAYVGSVRVQVVNNTIYLPTRWVVRILQETVDPSRFASSGDNSFVNNIVYVDNNLSTEVNIGSNTRPQTFTFSNNLWYNYQNPASSKPVLPVTETNGIIEQNPLFKSSAAEDFSLQPTSPAVGKGKTVAAPTMDFANAPFKTVRSIGALESIVTTATNTIPAAPELTLFPNPSEGILFVKTPELPSDVVLTIFNAAGMIVFQKIGTLDPGVPLALQHLASGVYQVQMITKQGRTTGTWMKYR